MIRRPAFALAAALGLTVSLLSGLSVAHATPVAVSLPAGAEPLRNQDTPLATLLLPVGPARGDAVPTRSYEGRVYRRSWRVTGDWSALQVLAPIRSTLVEQGFEEVFACTARACGGFAFRFGIEVIPAPDMAVNLSDYEFFAAEHPETKAVVSLLASRTGDSVYVQLLERQDPSAPLRPPATPDQLRPGGAAPTDPTAADPQAPPAGAGQPDPAERLLAAAIEKGSVLSTGAIADLLTLQGHAPLLDLEFASGSTRMGEGPFDTLEQLAAFLTAQETATILLVGHTDTVGGLDANINLSRRRAASVRQRLISRYGIAAGRIEVAGAGFMAPLGSNATEAGRETNRRVEAVLVTP
ncbi:OmpA family protein [Tritonibacter horizontis]|uniref:Outer membrane porin F n=1 Tax=Tritonibacter horizontis TaxID=1768241 RepID=A0A132BZE4_9RHOB|nr:OmpA family protein [Tritonibacter horizontis]KUP93729.1 outer membrane porin F precursor [Tritonibacter horizontis]